MKKTTLFLLFCGLLTTQANFVYQSGSSFTTTADLDGDGRSDLVLVDGSNATVRVGYQLSANTITWSAPRSLGLDEVTGVTCGNILNTGYDVLVATAPMLNRYHLYHLDSAATPLVPTSIYAAGLGPQSLAAMDIGGAGNTANDDLFSVSVMNGGSPYRLTSIRSDGTLLSSLSSFTITSAWSHMNEVEYAAGQYALGFIDGVWLRIHDWSAGTINQVDYVHAGFSASAAYVSFIPASGSYAQFLVWKPGQSELKALAITEPVPGSYEFSAPTTYDLGSPIESIQVVEGAGITRLAIIFDEGVAAAIFDYDGTGAPALLQEIYPPQNEFIAGFLSMGTDDLIMFSSVSGNFSGAVTADQQTFSGGQFVSTGTQQLAAGRVRNQANVMTFASEPFVDNAPRRLQLLRAGDWSSSSAVGAGVVSSDVETDSGTEYGLGSLQTVSLGAADPSAAYTLDNQLHAAISTYSFDAARGDELVGITVDPDPGAYGTSIAVSFSTDPSASVYYRTSPTASWVFHSAPFTLFKDTTVQYYAVGGTGQTIIHEAVYSFTDTPSDLDSDGDGVPDYVEIANGLDPLESGLDSDGDGYSDLDELLAGTDPTNAADVPAARIEQGSVYDLVLTPRPYDGVVNAMDKSAIDTQVRLFSASGGLRSYAKTTNLVLGVMTDNPAAHFPALSRSAVLPFLTAVSDTRFDVYSTTAGNQRGVELVGVYLQPDVVSIDVPYAYQGGVLSTEAANWVGAAQTAYAAQVRDIEVDSLGFEETLSGLMFERKVADLLYERGTISNAWISLFKGRTADLAMDGITVADLQSLETAGPGGEAAYHLPTLLSYFRTQVISMLQAQALAIDVYDTCSYYGRDDANAGQYPLPVGVLRTFMYSGELHSNYLAQSSQDAAQIIGDFVEINAALAGAPARSTGSFMLEVRADSFDAACPVLYTGGSVAKSLYTASGNPYRFPTTFTLQPGAQVSVEAYTDMTWNQCPGTDPLEVISLALTAVPTASGSDENGNLIPDDYESIFLVGSGGLATSDLDGDGYSDLQEYLDQTDPDNAASFGGSGPVDLSPPFIWIQSSDLSIDWPSAYADAFVFTVEYTGDLAGTPFAQEQELPRGNLDTTLDLSADQRFYRVKMRLR